MLYIQELDHFGYTQLSVSLRSSPFSYVCLENTIMILDVVVHTQHTYTSA